MNVRFRINLFGEKRLRNLVKALFVIRKVYHGDATGSHCHFDEG